MNPVNIAAPIQLEKAANPLAVRRERKTVAFDGKPVETADPDWAGDEADKRSVLMGVGAPDAIVQKRPKRGIARIRQPNLIDHVIDERLGDGSLNLILLVQLTARDPVFTGPTNSA